MKAKTQLKDVKVLVDDGRLIGMLVDGDMLRVETLLRNVSNLVSRKLDLYSVFDRNTGKMIIDNSRFLSRLVGVDRS